MSCLTARADKELHQTGAQATAASTRSDLVTESSLSQALMAPANPWIFRQIEQYVSKGSLGLHGAEPRHHTASLYDQPTESDRYQMIRTYFQMLLEEEMPGAEGKMKQFASWFTHGVPGGAALRKAIYEARGGAEILGRVEEFFEAKLTASAPVISS